MAFTKKLNRFGSDTFGLTISREMLSMLGSSIEEARSEEGAQMSLKMYGDTLVVRRVNAEPLTPAEAAFFLTEDMEFAKYFPASPVMHKDEVREAGGMLAVQFRPGKEVATTRLMKRVLNAFHAYGTFSRSSLSETLGITLASASNLLLRGVQDDLLIRQGNEYALNPDRFAL